MSIRFEVRESADPAELYPIRIVEAASGRVVGRYYRDHREAARSHCAALNAGTIVPVADPSADPVGVYIRPGGPPP